MPRTRTDAANRRVIDRWRTDPATALAATPKPARGAACRFVEILPADQTTQPAAAPPSRDLHIEIALPGGEVVRVGSGVEDELLRRVLRALT